MAEPPILEAITTAMKHMALRQRVLSENIANSETPRFKAREVEAPDFSKLLNEHLSTKTPKVAAPRVAITPKMAVLGAGSREPIGKVTLDRNTAETKPDGNNVSLEEQLLKIGAIQSDYTSLTKIGESLEGFLRAAIGRPKE